MTTSIVDDFLAEVEQRARTMIEELSRELLADSAKVEDLPQLLAPVLAMVAEHRAENLSRLEALVERQETGRALH